METLKIPLDYFPTDEIDIRVCGDKTAGLTYNREVSEWFSKFTGKKLDLIRKSPSHTRTVKHHYYDSNKSQDTSNHSRSCSIPLETQKPPNTWTTTLTQFVTSSWNKISIQPEHSQSQQQSQLQHQEEQQPKQEEQLQSHSQQVQLQQSPSQQIAFANESQFLLVSNMSVEEVQGRLQDKAVAQTLTFENFRPNLVINGGQPFQEDEWEEISIGDQYFVASGPCNRCTMICMDRNTLEIGNEPLKTLGKYRRQKGKILFGMLFEHDKSRSKIPFVLNTNMPIHVHKSNKHW